MIVATLRELMVGLPDDMLVLVASDPEGNDFHELIDTGVSPFVRDGWNFELCDDDEDEPKALVLWP